MSLRSEILEFHGLVLKSIKNTHEFQCTEKYARVEMGVIPEPASFIVGMGMKN